MRKRPEHPARRPLQARLCARVPDGGQLHLPSGRVQKNRCSTPSAVSARPATARRITTYSCVSSDEMQRRDPAAKPLHIPQVLYILARARGVHQRRHGGQALCGKGCAKGRGRPSGRHRAAGQGGAGQFPAPAMWWDIPRAAAARVNFDSQQRPHRRFGKMPAQHLRQNDLREFRGHRH